jgi:hypothetical protein
MLNTGSEYLKGISGLENRSGNVQKRTESIKQYAIIKEVECKQYTIENK